MRNIAAAYERPAAALDARQRLLAVAARPDDVAVAAPGLDASAPRRDEASSTIVSVLADGNEQAIREVLTNAGGRIVVDVEVRV
ncbi:MAG TPA: hypothetical protein VFR93_08745 [Candidatus Limnocylindrales bacterium]|nr:hypothetical protein [Candidatus Limnocylindrales bacterium]